MEFFHKQTNFPFMATRKVWYGLSAVLMIICFASFWVRGLNYALDFTGGVSVGVTFTAAADVEKVRSALVTAEFHEPQVQTFGSSREVAIRLQPILDTAGNLVASDVIRERLTTALKPLDSNVVVAPPDVVGP